MKKSMNERGHDFCLVVVADFLAIAIAKASVSPPCTWPSMIIGLMRVPQSSSA